MSPSAPRLFVRDEARADIAEAFRWYEERRPGLGYEYTRIVRVALAAIARAPEQHRPGGDDILRLPK